ncbi:MAG: potassium channel family protein [Sphingomonadales bacterium]|jgi:uncharacterized membrane protein|nr:potassium channel family protein [Sphingomonadales bacterium]
MTATTRTDHALERLVFFSDAVFAIAITLLVLEVHVPELPRGSPDSAYWQALLELIPGLIGYFVSFAVIGMFWIGHHRAFSLASRHSRKMVGWNLVLLGIIAFMPFATAFLTHNIGERVPSLVYCFVLLMAALLNILVVRIATGPEMVDPNADPIAVAYCRRRSLSVAFGALTALVLSFWFPRYCQIGLASIGLWRRLIAGRAPTGRA